MKFPNLKGPPIKIGCQLFAICRTYAIYSEYVRAAYNETKNSPNYCERVDLRQKASKIRIETITTTKYTQRNRKNRKACLFTVRINKFVKFAVMCYVTRARTVSFLLLLLLLFLRFLFSLPFQHHHQCWAYIYREH